MWGASGGPPQTSWPLGATCFARTLRNGVWAEPEAAGVGAEGTGALLPTSGARDPRSPRSSSGELPG